MNWILQAKREETKTNSEISFSPKKPEISKDCLKCLKHEKEINEIIYIKSQIEQKYEEERWKFNLVSKQKTDLDKQNIKLHSINNELKTESSLLKHEITELDKIIKILRSTQNNNQQQQEETANAQIPKHKMICDYDISQYSNKINWFAKRNCELESKITEMVMEKTKTDQLLNSLTTMNKELTSRLSKENENRQNLEHTVRELSEFKNRYETKLQVLENNLQVKRAEWYNQNETEKKWNLQIITANTSNFDCQNKYNEFSIQYNKVKEENASLKSKLKEFENEIFFLNSNLKKQKENNSNFNQNNELILKENLELKLVISKLEEELKKQKSIPLKDTELENKLFLRNDLLNKDNEKYLSEIQRWTNENEFLRKNYDNNTQMGDNNYSDNKITVQKISGATIMEYEAKIEDLLHEKNTLSRNFINLMEDNQSKQTMINEYNNKIVKITNDYEELNLQINSLEQENCKLQQEIIKNNIRNTDLIEENINKHGINNKLTYDLSNKAKDMETSKLMNERLIQNNNNKEENIWEWNSRIYQLQKVCEDKTKEINELKLLNTSNEKTIKKLNKDKKWLIGIIQKK